MPFSRIKVGLVVVLVLINCVSSFPAVAQQPATAPPVNFVNLASKAGIAKTVTFGGTQSKTYIIETTGTGVAIFDYDNDGWPDIFVVNGTTLDAVPGKGPTSYLLHNNHDGTFSDVSQKVGTGGQRLGSGCLCW